MDRDAMIARLDDRTPWDVLVVGGGATGLGTAIDAAARGYRTLLLEQDDFAKGTSSRSTKLVHGGVRYLQQGNVALVLDALRERGRLLKNAPHLVHDLPFVVPVYDWWEGPFYGVGLKLYDVLAGKAGFGPSKKLTREETLARLPTLEPTGLRGGVIYYDGQFDDARLAVTMARTAADLGATLVNYVRVAALTKQNGLIDGVLAHDSESGRAYTIPARVVVNATGIFTDAVRRMDDPAAVPMLRMSQGIHLVLDRTFLPGESAIMVPRTDDARVLFAIPWYERTLIGTTDTPVPGPALEPRPLAGEVEFLLTHAARYLTRDPSPDDVLSVFAGLRPLVAPGGGEPTAAISRDHTLVIAPSGLVTITGGKWTTYRRMAKETVDAALQVAGVPDRPSVTKALRLHGWHPDAMRFGSLAPYGADAPDVQDTLREQPGWDAPLHENLPYRLGEVVWAVRREMARTVEDVLARRTRALLLDARASRAAAPAVARLMAAELGRDEAWVQRQVEAFDALAAGYLLG